MQWTEDSSINAIIYKCKDMIEAVEYFDVKMDLGQDLVETFNKYMRLKLEVQGIENKVIRGEQTKEMALKEIDSILEEQGTCYVAMTNFFTKTRPQNIDIWPDDGHFLRFCPQIFVVGIKSYIFNIIF